MKKRSYKIGGLDNRYRIFARDGGEELDTSCRFVLNYGYDPHARAALAYYAESVRLENPQLANDIKDRLIETMDLKYAEKPASDG